MKPIEEAIKWNEVCNKLNYGFGVLVLLCILLWRFFFCSTLVYTADADTLDVSLLCSSRHTLSKTYGFGYGCVGATLGKSAVTSEKTVRQGGQMVRICGTMLKQIS